MQARWTRVRRANSGPLRSGVAMALAAVLGAAAPAGAADRPSSRAAGKPSVVMPQVAFIDAAIAEGWAKAKVKPARPATDEEFLRRAYLDLFGRIPNIHEARSFLATREADKRGKL